MDMNPTTARQFYRNFRDLNVNIDPAAKRQRNTYDQNLRKVPEPAGEKLLRTQNAILRQELQKAKRQNVDSES